MPICRKPRLKRAPLVVLVLLCVGVIACVGTAVFQAARVSGCKAASANGLQQIQLAMENYRQANGSYPPQYLADKEGRPAHSWRVLIWPYLCGDDSWRRYRFDEPWDGPHNKLLASETPVCFRSPNADRQSKSTVTDYVGIVGKGTPWRGTSPLRMQDMHGRSRKIVWFVEVANSGINWMEPRDISLEQALVGINVAGGIQSNYADGLPAQLMPYGCEFLPVGTPPEAFRAMLTVTGGKDEASETAPPAR
jgi:type II secretory pathway pseudopilin PulG